jgi:hypothetical protein
VRTTKAQTRKKKKKKKKNLHEKKKKKCLSLSQTNKNSTDVYVAMYRAREMPVSSFRNASDITSSAAAHTSSCVFGFFTDIVTRVELADVFD